MSIPYARALSLLTLLVSTHSYAGTCPSAPDWMTWQESPGNCVYAIARVERFSDADFVKFLDSLSRDSGGLLKTVRLPAGDFHFNRSIEITGANGWLLHLEGESAAATRLIFHNVHGLNIEGPFAIGLANKLTFNGNGKKGMENNALTDKYGILARRGANIRLGNDVVVEEFSRAGVQAFMSSTIYAARVISRKNGSDGFVASFNSTVYARNAISYGNRGDGFFAEAASSIDAAYSVAKGNLTDKSNGQSRGGDGYVTRLGGVINADHAEVDANEDQDFVAVSQGLISARDAKFRGRLKFSAQENATFLAP